MAVAILIETFGVLSFQLLGQFVCLRGFQCQGEGAGVQMLAEMIYKRESPFCLQARTGDFVKFAPSRVHSLKLLRGSVLRPPNLIMLCVGWARRGVS